MKASDESLRCETCKCSKITETDHPTLTLKSESFHIKENVTEPKSVAKRVKHFRPLVCSRFKFPYTCTKTLHTKIPLSHVLVIASGFAKSAAVTIDSDTKYSESLTDSGFNIPIDGFDTKEFDTESSKFSRTLVDEKSTVSVKVSFKPCLKT